MLRPWLLLSWMPRGRGQSRSELAEKRDEIVEASRIRRIGRFPCATAAEMRRQSDQRDAEGTGAASQLEGSCGCLQAEQCSDKAILHCVCVQLLVADNA